MSSTRNVLIVGIPRSGTTWVAKVLSSSPGCHYIHEPDNEKSYALAYSMKSTLHRYPYVCEGSSANSYYELWKSAFEGKVLPKKINAFFRFFVMPRNEALEREIGAKCSCIHSSGCFKYVNNTRRRDDNVHHMKKFLGKRYSLASLSKFLTKRIVGESETTVIKSVHCLLSLPWLQEHFNSTIILVFRHPFNVISSYLKMGLPDAVRNIFSQRRLIDDHFSFIDPGCFRVYEEGSIIQKMAIQVGAFYYFLEKEVIKHPNWHIVFHEDLCIDSCAKYQRLYKKADLKWDEDVKRFIEDSNRGGSGFSTSRISKQEVQKWKTILSKQQVREISNSINMFNLRYYADL
ncbi:MAG: sulfotransferase [Desulfobacterales bacterium]